MELIQIDGQRETLESGEGHVTVEVALEPIMLLYSSQKASLQE